MEPSSPQVNLAKKWNLYIPLTGPFWPTLKASDLESAQNSRFRATLSISNRLAPPSEDSDNGIRKLLLNQMIRAKRNGTWFSLPRRERGLFELAMRLEVKLRSFDLLRALVSVLKDLKETCDRGGMAFVKAKRLVWTISEAAASWGNAEAREWRKDLDYIRFLAMGVEYR